MARYLTVKLTEAEAKALLACADEGFEGLGSDEGAAKAYLGGQRGIDATSRAMDTLKRALGTK